MRKLVSAVFLVLMFTGSGFAKESQLEKANNVLNEIMRTPDKAIPHDLFEKAVCVGIVPSEIKGAFMVGGTYGRGVLVCRKHGDGPWGAPSMFSLGEGSFGFQIGGESTDVVFIVMNGSGARKLIAEQGQARRGYIRNSGTRGPFRGRRDRRPASRRNLELLADARLVCRGFALRSRLQAGS